MLAVTPYPMHLCCTLSKQITESFESDLLNFFSAATSTHPEAHLASFFPPFHSPRQATTVRMASSCSAIAIISQSSKSFHFSSIVVVRNYQVHLESDADVGVFNQRNGLSASGRALPLFSAFIPRSP